MPYRRPFVRRTLAVLGVILVIAMIVEVVSVPLVLNNNSDSQARAACAGLLAIRSGIIRQAADQANGLIDFAVAAALKRGDKAAAARTRAFRTPYVSLQVMRARAHNPKPSCARIVAGKTPVVPSK